MSPLERAMTLWRWWANVYLVASVLAIGSVIAAVEHNNALWAALLITALCLDVAAFYGTRHWKKVAYEEINARKLIALKVIQRLINEEKNPQIETNKHETPTE